MSERDKKRDKDVIEAAKEHFNLCEEGESDNREGGLDDLIFLAGEQWSAWAKQERLRDHRPMLVVNRLDQFVQHITNSQRQNRVSAKVIPVDDKADIETAEVRQGLLRHIEYNSRADYAYDTAEFYAVAMGWGFWRLARRFCHAHTFDQDLFVERLRNPFQGYLDPSHDQPDGSDAEFGFITVDFTKEEYERQFEASDLAGAKDWAGIGDNPGDWLKDAQARVVEYFTKEYRKDTLYLVRGPSGVEEVLKSEMPETLPQGFEVARERDTQVPTVKIYTLNAIEILEEEEWPGQHIPLVKVIGNELDVNGKLTLKGIVRNLKDAQRQYNFMLSAQAEAIDASKGQVLVEEGQLEGHESEWQDMSKRKVLTYKGVNVNGKPLGPPVRLVPNVSIPAMTEARMLAADDLKALTGVYDAALGARSNETSGTAINQRQQQTDTANFHFQDNLTRSVGHSTRMLNDAMSHVYDGERVIRIIGEDDAHRVVKINQDFTENNETKRYDFAVGKYDVVCTAGPSFQSKRQQASELLVGLAKVAPQIMVVAPDYVMKSIDVPYGQEIADRFKKMLPPQLQEQEDGDQKVPPEVQQKLAALMQQHELLTQALNDANQKLESKSVETESKERVEAAKLALEQQRLALEERRLDMEMAKLHEQLNSAESIALLKAEVDAIKVGLNLDAQAAAQEAGAAAEAM